MIDKVPNTFERVGYDINEYIIELLTALSSGWQPPKHIDKEKYHWVKNNKDVDKVLTGWCGVNLSYCGKWFRGYAGFNKTKTGLRNYQQEAIDNVMKQSKRLIGVLFEHKCYSETSFENCLIYCDPPYKNTSDYKTGDFNHRQFFEWCREMKTKGNLVFVSEYEAPPDFECVWQKEVKSSLNANGKSGKSKKSVEKLFFLP